MRGGAFALFGEPCIVIATPRRAGAETPNAPASLLRRIATAIDESPDLDPLSQPGLSVVSVVGRRTVWVACRHTCRIVGLRHRGEVNLSDITREGKKGAYMLTAS